MEQLKSNMPAFGEIKAEHTMRMVQVRLSDLSFMQRTLNFDYVVHGVHVPVKAYVYEVSDPRLGGFPPAKVWETGNEDIIALFYATAAVTPENRPFGPGNTYIAVFDVTVDDVIEYNVDVRAAIMQIVNAEGTLYVVAFGDSEYNVIVQPPEEK